MAVDLTYRDASGAVVRHTVATSASFRSLWKKAARSLHLELVGSLDQGIALDRGEVLRLLAELSQLARWARTKPDLLARVERLESELRRALQAETVAVSFG